MQCGSDDTSESAGRFREQDGVGGAGEVETMLGLREAGLSDSVHIANLGSKSIVCDAVIDRNEQLKIRSLVAQVRTETRNIIKW